MILERLALDSSAALPNKHILPWRQSLARKRREESVRPIFWKNNPKSYVSRTMEWDEFPNGRWGNVRSPAFGALDGYVSTLKVSNEQAIKLWGRPETLLDLENLFISYCRGEISMLPWSEGSVSRETESIKEQLVRVNKLGFLTTNSQPAVDGASSSDPVHGWGPKNGYVYQKSYLEFFVSNELLDSLLSLLESDPCISFYAINEQGDLRTNSQNDGPNAVTWGVYPGKEIIQPTIVEAASFVAWKDEAYELGRDWAKCYPQGSPSRELIESIMGSWYLVNIVHNDYHLPNAIFDLLSKFAAYEISSTNGQNN